MRFDLFLVMEGTSHFSREGTLLFLEDVVREVSRLGYEGLLEADGL